MKHALSVFESDKEIVNCSISAAVLRRFVKIAPVCVCLAVR